MNHEHPPRVVLVTGASSGIGRATALCAARRGDHLGLVARGLDALETTARECLEAGATSATVLVADVGDDQAVAAAVARMRAEHGVINLVVHAAGVVAYGRTEDVPLEIFEGVLRTNLTGTVNLARHVVPMLRDQQRGGLVIIGSVIGHIAVPLMSPYVLSKWAVRALARQLQIENRDLPNVHIAYVAPGGVDTPIYAQAATTLGVRGRPPPPVDSPERVARIAIRRGERDQLRSQVGVANDVLRLGFNAMPKLYDVLVGPLFAVAALDRTRPVADGPGNVLTTHQTGNALHGNQGGALLGVLRNLRTVIMTGSTSAKPSRSGRDWSQDHASSPHTLGTGSR